MAVPEVVINGAFVETAVVGSVLPRRRSPRTKPLRAIAFLGEPLAARPGSERRKKPPPRGLQAPIHRGHKSPGCSCNHSILQIIPGDWLGS
jgi:hypothetical protein